MMYLHYENNPAAGFTTQQERAAVKRLTYSKDLKINLQLFVEDCSLDLKKAMLYHQR